MSRWSRLTAVTGEGVMGRIWIDTAKVEAVLPASLHEDGHLAPNGTVVQLPGSFVVVQESVAQVMARVMGLRADERYLEGWHVDAVEFDHGRPVAVTLRHPDNGRVELREEERLR